jgi:uncharacterized RDD family membrane protein YckC
MNREGFLIRAGAALIDGVICFIPAAIFTFVAAVAVGPYIAGLLSTGIFVAYSTLEIFKGATFGKILLKLKICNEDGTDAARNVLIKRWAIKQAYTLIYFLAAVTTLTFLNYFGHFAAIAFIISALLTFKAERQTLHDTLCKTAVFKTAIAAISSQATPATSEPQKQAA